MGRSSLNDVLSLTDPAQTWNWDIFFPTIPGASNTRELTFKAMTTSIPSAMLEEVPVELHGVSLRFAGRATFNHSFSVQFLETRNHDTREIFSNWREIARSWQNNSGSYASAYKVNIDLALYDDLPQIVRTIRMYGVWPQSIDDISLDGGSSGIVQVGVTFAFDWVQSVS